MPVAESLSRTLKEMQVMQNEALQEVVSHLTKEETVNVTVNTDSIGKAIKDGLKNMPAPVVNIEKSEPRSYYATIERNRHGEMTGARIDPVLADKPQKTTTET